MEQFLDPLFFYGLVYFLVFANVLLYGVNDIFDVDTDVYNPKKGTREELGLGRARTLGAASAASAAAALPLARGPVEAGLVSLFLFLCVAYSAPPFRLKARPFVDSYTNWLYIVPAALGYYMSSGQLMPPWAFAAGVFWTAGMHALSAVPDIEADRRAGVSTVATRLGRRGALLFVFVNWAAASAILAWRDLLLAPSALYPAVALYLYARCGQVETWYWRFPFINAAMGAGAFFYAVRDLVLNSAFL